MRHFRLLGAIAALACGMGVTAARTVLIASAGAAQGLNTRLPCALTFAVAVTMIAAAADEYGASAAGT